MKKIKRYFQESVSFVSLILILFTSVNSYASDNHKKASDSYAKKARTICMWAMDNDDNEYMILLYNFRTPEWGMIIVDGDNNETVVSSTISTWHYYGNCDFYGQDVNNINREEIEIRMLLFDDNKEFCLFVIPKYEDREATNEEIKAFNVSKETPSTFILFNEYGPGFATKNMMSDDWRRGTPKQLGKCLDTCLENDR